MDDYAEEMQLQMMRTQWRTLSKKNMGIQREFLAGLIRHHLKWAQHSETEKATAHHVKIASLMQDALAYLDELIALPMPN